MKKKKKLDVNICRWNSGRGLRLKHSLGLQKQNKEKKSNFKTQVTKEKSMWAGKNRTNKNFKTKDIAFKEV